MKKRIFIAFLVAICVMLTLSGCKPKTTLQSTELIEMNTEPSYFKFPKTDWGMTPQEVMKAWGFTLEDVTMEPGIEETDFSLNVSMTLHKDFELIGEPVDNITFKFVYLLVAGAGKGELGLTRVIAKFDSAATAKVKDAVENFFGKRPSTGQICKSEANFLTLPADVRQTIIDVFSNSKYYSDYNTNPKELSLASFIYEEERKSPYQPLLIYGGEFAAKANADYSNYYAAIADVEEKYGIND